MFVKLNNKSGDYYVGFELDRRQPRAITHCKIYLLSNSLVATLAGCGETLQSRKDEFNSVTGRKFALKRALSDANLGKGARTAFWKEFNHRVICREAFTNVGGLPRKLIDSEARRICAHRIVSKGSGLNWCTKHRVDCMPEVKCGVHAPVYAGGRRTVHGYGGQYSFQKRAREKMLALSNPTGHGPGTSYARLRHDYRDNPHEYHDSGTVFFRKLYGLGWKKIIDDRTGETFWPRSRLKKREQYARAYSMGEAMRYWRNEPDYPKLERRIFWQAESRCHRAGQEQKITIINSMAAPDQLKQLFVNKDKIYNILDENKKKMSWPVADDRLTARMLAMSLEVTELVQEIDIKLLRRPGITKVHDEYIIDIDKFVPAFKVGDMVTYKGDRTKVFSVSGPLVTLHVNSDGKSYEVFDHELETWTRPHWLRKVGRALARMWGETAFDRAIRADASNHNMRVSP